jgi:hypothetical protein
MAKEPLRFVTLGLSICVVAAFARPPAKEVRGEHRSPLLPREEFLHLIGASNQQLVADYFWIQAIHAVGAAQTAAEYRDIFFYADLVTDLDPAFKFVYRFCGPAIPLNMGREVWVNTLESTQLLEKGVQAHPKDVLLRILLAYNLSYYHKNYRYAASLVEETAKLPGAPRYLNALATRLYAQSGDIDAGLALAHSIYNTAEDPETREAFDRRIKELQLERILRQIDSAVAAYAKREGHLPAQVQELVKWGDLPALPSDPLGGDLTLATDGHSQSTALARRLTLYSPTNN